MYRIMIVDDEPYIADSLKELIEEESSLAVEVFKAYSGVEALELMGSMKMDIVLTDIRMPELDGLQLQQQVLAQWPRCKVIFLTGHEHFEYVQTAIRSGGFDYILKTENDNRIIDALTKALRVLEEEFEYRSVLEQAHRKHQNALPLLRHQFLSRLLEGERFKEEVFRKRCGELGVQLDPFKPVWFVAGRVDAWPAEHILNDKSLLLYSIHNIAEEYFAAQSSISIVEDRMHFFWMIGFHESGEMECELSIVEGLLESIQLTCRQLLSLTLSFAIGREPVSCADLAQARERTMRVLRKGLGSRKEMILWEGHPFGQQRSNVKADRNSSLGRLTEFVRVLRMNLDAGDLESILSLCREWSESLSGQRDEYSTHAEYYYSIAVVFLSYINDNGLHQQQLFQSMPHRLMQMDKHVSWEEAFRYFMECAEQLVRYQAKEQDDLTNEWVSRIHRFIDIHLEEDLTLRRIADFVYLNPAYLSRLYKQMTGHGLFEHIKRRRIEEAQYLLKETQVKIHEIGRRIGMEAPAYFSRFFRKETNLTPQEYRDRTQKR